jgi:hypothetical protein
MDSPGAELEAEAATFGHDTLNELGQALLDRPGAFEGKIEALGNQAEQDERRGDPSQPAGAFEKIRDADLVHREPGGDGRRHFVSLQTDERAGRLIVTDSVHQDCRIGILELREQREPERASVDDARPLGSLVGGGEPPDGGDTEAVIAAEQVAKPEHEERGRPGCGNLSHARPCGR